MRAMSCAVALVLALSTGLAAENNKVTWEKNAEAALKLSAETEKPVCFYFTTGEAVGGKAAPGC